MSTPLQILGYGPGTGLVPVRAFYLRDHDPTPSDVTPNYVLYSGWVNTHTKGIWYLESISSSNGETSALWRAVAPIVTSSSAPTTADIYPLGQTWVDTTLNDYWVLINVTGSTATWIKISAGTEGVDLFSVQTGTTPVGPNGSGTVAFSGAVVAAGTNPVRTDGTSATAMALEVQISQAIASTDATKIGLSNFNSAQFSVDANGFVSLSGGGAAIDSIQVDNTAGTGVNPVVPNGSGLVQVTCAQVTPSGFGNALRTITNAPNQYSITVQQTDVSATTNTTKNGVAHFDSNFFTTDGTGFVSLKSATTGTIAIQIFATSGTYTPTAGMDYCIIEGVGAGAGGGGTTDCSAIQVSAGGGGGSGSYSRLVASAATIGASQTVTIGAGGTAGTSAGGNGGNGGDSSVGSLLIAKGGSGGTGSGAAASTATQGGSGGVAGTGTFSCVGSQGGDGISSTAGGTGNFSCGGQGGGSFFGGATNANSTTSGQQVGLTGQQYGGGGSGASTSPSGTGVGGGAGFAGFIVVTEFI